MRLGESFKLVCEFFDTLLVCTLGLCAVVHCSFIVQMGLGSGLMGGLTAFGAVLGRVLGTLSKLPIAIGVWVLLAVAAFRS